MLDKCFTNTNPPHRTEQNLIVLLATMLEKEDKNIENANKLSQLLCKMLSGISKDYFAWHEAFENGFVKSLFLEMLNQEKVKEQVLSILMVLIKGVALKLESSLEVDFFLFYGIIRVLFNVVMESEAVDGTESCGEQVLTAANTIVRISTLWFSKNFHVAANLAVSALSVSGEILVKLSKTQSADGNSALPQSAAAANAIKEISECARKFLSNGECSGAVQLKVNAVVFLAASVRLNGKESTTIAQEGLKVIDDFESLKFLQAMDWSTGIDSIRAVSSKEIAKMEMAAATTIVRALLTCFSKEHSADSRTLIRMSAVPLYRSCMNAHMHGEYYYEEWQGGETPLRPCVELKGLTTLVCELFAEELRSVQFAESQCKWLIVSSMEYCNELLNGHDLSADTSQCALRERSLARLLSFIRAVSLGVNDAELISTAYYSFVELLSHGSSHRILKEFVRDIVAIACASSDREKFIELTAETFSGMFARILLARDNHSNFISSSSELSLLQLDGLSKGLDSVARHYLDADSMRLLGLRKQLILLFERLAADIYSSEVTHSGELGIGLGYLLLPLSTAFLRPHNAPPDDLVASKSSMQILRCLWYSLVTFRLKERKSWNSKPEWLDAYQTIAAHCPALVLGAAGSCAALLENEFSSSHIINSMARSQQNDLAKVWPKVAQFPISGLNFTQIMYGVTCQYLESLRVGGTLDIRPLFSYLSDDGVESSPWLRNTIVALSHHVFTVWLDSTCDQLRGTADSSVPSWRMRSVVGQIFEFLVGHCSSHNELLRQNALMFARRTLDRITWLMWTPTAVFTLLDSMQALSVHAHSLTREANGSSFMDSLADTAICENATADTDQVVRSIDPDESDAMRLINSLLPASALPQDMRSLTEASQGIVTLAMHWLSTASKIMPAELDTIVQEYLLLDRVKGVFSHAGVALAKALTASSSSSSSIVNSPVFVPCGSDSIQIRAERLAASMVAPSSGSNSSEVFTAELSLKSMYIGELIGMLQAEESSNTHLSWSSPSLRPMLVFVTVAMKLHTALAEQIPNSSPSDSQDLVAAIWRSVALIHNMCLVLLQPSETDECVEPQHVRDMWAWVHRMIHQTASCAALCYCNAVVETLVLGWRWLFLSYPRLRNRVYFECMSTLQLTCQQRQGIFSENFNADFLPHEVWICFLERNITSFGDFDSVVFFFMETILFSSSHLNRKSPAAMMPRFRLLSLGMKAISASMSSLHGPSVERRRALRERVIHCAFDWFEDTSSNRMNTLRAREGFSVLNAFLADISEDLNTWSGDYKKSDEQQCSSSDARIAGEGGATSFLQASTGLGYEGLHAARQMPSAVESFIATQRLLGIDAEQMGCKSGTLCLLRMLLLHEIDRYASWLFPDQKSFETSDLSLAMQRSRHDLTTISTTRNYKSAIKAAWCISPSLAINLAGRFPKLEARDGRSKGLSHLSLFLITSPSIPDTSDAIPLLLSCIDQLSGRSSTLELLMKQLNSQKLQVLVTLGYDLSALQHESLRKFVCCQIAPLHVAVDMLSRLHGKASDFIKSEFAENRHCCTEVVRFAVRCVRGAESSAMLHFAPQLVQLLRQDEFGVVHEIIRECCLRSALICHHFMWLLVAEAAANSSLVERHGYCAQLPAPDSLPLRSALLIQQIRAELSPRALQYLDDQLVFFSRLIEISCLLKKIPDKSTHSSVIFTSLSGITVTDGLYMPSDSSRKIVGVERQSGVPMASAAKSPYLLTFKTQNWEGPDAYLSWLEKGNEPSEILSDPVGLLPVPIKKIPVRSTPHKTASEARPKTPRRLSLSWPPFPPSPSLTKELRMQAVKIDPEAAVLDVQLESYIFKMHDDTRQDLLTLRVVGILHDEFERLSLPLFLAPYSIIPTCTGDDKILGGIIRVIPNSKSRDQIGKGGGGKTIREYFINKFGAPSSAGFKQAQLAFASSLAAYAVLCYILQIKVSGKVTAFAPRFLKSSNTSTHSRRIATMETS